MDESELLAQALFDQREAREQKERERVAALEAELTAAQQRIAELTVELADKALLLKGYAALDAGRAEAEQRGYERGKREGVEMAAKECERSMPDVYGDVEDITGQFVRAIRKLMQPEGAGIDVDAPVAGRCNGEPQGEPEGEAGK